jgi:tRNA/tmRNA/rRNA uracil-C5-methylase (TrmA/RlmC/RlmD family)
MEDTILTITEIPYGGRGLGRLNGKVCFVPGVLPGETVRVRLIRDRADFIDAEPCEILTPSPHRLPPACPFARGLSNLDSRLSNPFCPGCSYQHATYEEEVRIKHGQLRALLARHAGAGDDALRPPVAAPAPLGYRNKMALHAQVDGSDMRLGYFMGDNTTVLDIPACPLACPALNDLLAERRRDPSFFRTLKDGMTVTFRWTRRDGAVWWRKRASENDVWLVESSVIGPLAVPRNSFYQMNPAMSDHLVTAVQSRLQESPSRTVVDLYCGVGVFALAAAVLGTPHVMGVDLDGPGIKAAEFNARKLGLTNTQWKAATAQDGVLGLGLDRPDETTLIVDPPRSGLGRKLVQEIVRRHPRRILYISCAPDTMARDAAWLKEGGYSLRSSQLFDLFPRTAHFESLTEFQPADPS